MPTSPSPAQVLVVDVGTSRIRASVVDRFGAVLHTHEQALIVDRPSQGTVEFDAAAMGKSALQVAKATLDDAGAVAGVGIAAQRASTIVWDARTGAPIAPGIGWQDVRTTGQCLALRARGIELSPNQSATKLALLLHDISGRQIAHLRFGTVETYVAWVLSRGTCHTTDATNAAVTGLMLFDGTGWDEKIIAALDIDPVVLPLIVSSSGEIGIASELPGAPPIAALCGDQQASLVGQGCVKVGDAKMTFGTGGMLDVCLGPSRPSFARRGEAGTFPIIAWQDSAAIHWGIEAIMLTAGTCVDWLARELQLISEVSESDALAASVPDSGGAMFIPALGGMGTPVWDFGARGTFVGLQASTSHAELVRSVLEGIAHRGADLLEACEQDAAISIEQLRLDGGMSGNHTFVSLLAAACQRPIALSSVTEATTRGAGYLAGTAVGIWGTLQEATTTATPRAIVEPTARLDRGRWIGFRERALRTVPALSAISF